ncbi:MAG: M23 family metallopeptidase, partial [Actinobacteria bacterium]|nr:M23 family metallopeptidase [Actinomycetota bacterium]
MFPVEGFQGPVDLHHGQHPGAADIFAPPGTRVLAMVGGTVTHAAYDELGGWNVYVQGDDGLDYYYAHLIYQPVVKAGQRIQRDVRAEGLRDCRQLELQLCVGLNAVAPAIRIAGRQKRLP